MQLCGSEGGLIQGLMMFTLLVSLISFPFSLKNYQNIPLSDRIREELGKKKTQKKLAEDEGSALTFLFRKYGYIPLQNTVCTAVQFLFFLVVNAALRSEIMADTDGTVLGLSLKSRVADSFRTGGDRLTAGAGLLLAAMFLQFLHDRLLERNLVTDEMPLNLILNGGLLVGGCFLPLAFALYWGVRELIDLTLMFFIGRKNAAGTPLRSPEDEGETPAKEKTGGPKKKAKGSGTSKYDG